MKQAVAAPPSNSIQLKNIEEISFLRQSVYTTNRQWMDKKSGKPFSCPPRVDEQRTEKKTQEYMFLY